LRPLLKAPKWKRAKKKKKKKKKRPQEEEEYIRLYISQ
jgi:hypothetical protein